MIASLRNLQSLNQTRPTVYYIHNTLQEPLSAREKQEILSELRTSDRLREALDVVEIVLGFLSSGGGRAEKPLGEYIDKMLKMKRRPFSSKVLLLYDQPLCVCVCVCICAPDFIL
jgi:hypothetical protein